MGLTSVILLLSPGSGTGAGASSDPEHPWGAGANIPGVLGPVPAAQGQGAGGLRDRWAGSELSRGHSGLDGSSGTRQGAPRPAPMDAVCSSPRILLPKNRFVLLLQKKTRAGITGISTICTVMHMGERAEPHHPLTLPGKAEGAGCVLLVSHHRHPPQPSAPQAPALRIDGDRRYAAILGGSWQHLGPAGLLLWGNLGISQHTHAGLAARG